jgi:DNA (cytosine-5)-methyltransferase 1
MLCKPYRMVDLFSGCGGLSRGFEWTGRFGTELGVELHPHPAKAFARNIRNTSGDGAAIYEGDITNLARDESLLWATLRKAGVGGPEEIDVLAGGPPCQGFSRNGPRLYVDEDRTERFYDHPNNHLYRSFLTFVDELSPKIVLVENVREFLKFGGGKFSDDLKLKFNEMGYEVRFQKVNAADFGVPQNRHRIFFVAVRKDVADRTGFGPEFPCGTFVPGGEDGTLGLFQAHRTVRDAISDLPSPAVNKNDLVHYDLRVPVSMLAERLRSSKGTVHNHVGRQLSKIQVERINAVGSGRMKHIKESLKTEKFYGSAYRRLSWDKPALTITTWVYHVGSGQFAHPSEDRGVTMREAARLQSFDDDFVFPPFVNPTSQMIGNAVPPLVAHAFAQQFTKILDKYYDIEEEDARVARSRNAA